MAFVIEYVEILMMYGRLCTKQDEIFLQSPIDLTQILRRIVPFTSFPTQVPHPVMQRLFGNIREPVADQNSQPIIHPELPLPLENRAEARHLTVQSLMCSLRQLTEPNSVNRKGSVTFCLVHFRLVHFRLVQLSQVTVESNFRLIFSQI